MTTADPTGTPQSGPADEEMPETPDALGVLEGAVMTLPLQGETLVYTVTAGVFVDGSASGNGTDATDTATGTAAAAADLPPELALLVSGDVDGESGDEMVAVLSLVRKARQRLYLVILARRGDTIEQTASVLLGSSLTLAEMEIAEKQIYVTVYDSPQEGADATPQRAEVRTYELRGRRISLVDSQAVDLPVSADATPAANRP